jgi:organic radical activating enzyme
MPDYQLTSNLLTQPVSIHVAGTAPAAAALLANTAPPDDAPMVIATGDLSISGGTTISFAGQNAPIAFSASVTAEIEILPSPSSLTPEITNGLDLADQLAPALSFPAADESHWAMLRWGYNLDENASGSVALGAAVSMGFSEDAGRSGIFSVVRQVPDKKADGTPNGCDDILRDLIASWRLPKQVTSLNSIPPGTWIIAETNGQISLGVNVTYGYNFNWIRQATLNTLSGDIGLKLQVGLAANLGFCANGKYGVVVSRGTGSNSDQISFRVYRLRVRNWNAGFSATVGVTPVNTLLPASFDDLIAGALGTSGAQIVKALQDVDSWTQPGQPLLGPFVGVGEDYLNGFVHSVTGLNLNDDLTAVQTRLETLLNTWNNLPQTAAQLIWSHLPDATAISRISGLAGDIATATPGSIAQLIGGKLQNVSFFDTPEGQMLESLASKDLFTALGDTGELQHIQSLASQVQSILDGSDLQTLITKIQSEVSKRLDISQINNIVDDASVANLDSWLTQKLTAFLNEVAPVPLAKLTALRDQIHKLLGMRDEFYSKALDALNNTYTFSLSAAYQNTSTTDALFDAVFDFGKDAADAGRCLALALDGQIGDLMAGDPHPAMTLNRAVLTHGVKRQSNVELTFPYFDQTTTHVNDVLASISAVNHGEGRLLGVSSTDRVTDVVNKRNKRDSTLTFSLSLASSAQTGLVIHDQPTATGSYSLINTFAGMSEVRFLSNYQTSLQNYFASEFAAGHGSVHDYADDLTAATKGSLGAGKVSLQVTIPPAVLLAWMKAPADPKDPIYKDVAKGLAGRLRQLMLQQYFSDITKYDDVAKGSPAFALLAYSSVPLPFNTSHLDLNGQLVVSQDLTSLQLHWDEARDANLVNAMLRWPQGTQVGLANTLTAVNAMLLAEGRSSAKFYSNAPQFTEDAIANPFIGSLFDTESDLVNNARKAGVKIASFLKSNATQSDVFGELEGFASGLTAAFNAGLQNWATDSLLTPMGPVLMEAAARVFDPTVAQLQPNAMFTVDTAGLTAPQRLVRIADPMAAGAGR